MGWYSVYGTGATIHGIERTEDGRVRFTSWLSLFWVPLVPLRSWSAVYLGEGLPDGVTDESHRFGDIRRIPHDWGRNVQTFARGILMAGLAVAPSAIMIARTNGRAATTVEMITVFAGILWAVGLVFWSEHLRRKALRGIE
jgi:hypothetical protein